jgi:heme-degrading monooxygenase HmoA
MLTHTVQFRFKSNISETERERFMEALHGLSSIPGVQDFGIFNQKNQGNSFEYLATMRFQTQAEYQAYSSHPRHSSFIATHWIPKIDTFLEGDYEEWQA